MPVTGTSGSDREASAARPREPYVSGTHEHPVREGLGRRAVDCPVAATRAVGAFGLEAVLYPHALEVREGAGAARRIGPGPGALPVADLTCLAAAPNGDLWIGSRHGAIRYAAGRFELYAGRRWLPDNEVRAMAVEADGSVCVWTASGGSRIRYPRLSLTDKAAHYQRLTDTRHVRFGYVTGCGLARPGDLTETVHHIDDNDGLWTAMYVAAESFRYAATGDPDARDTARRSLLALLELERLTGVPGLPARALTHRSEPDFGQPRPGEWHVTTDGEWEWKGDTSSDEIDGHYFAWGIYHDLAADAAEQARIRATVRRVTDRIVDHGFYLPDSDGEPTRWGVWAPERLNADPAWRAERGLNSLEILSYLKVASHICGETRYERVYRQLIAQHHYGLNVLRQKVQPGDFPDAEDNHSDDELAFLAYYNLLRYEADPGLRSLYMASLERSWQIARPETCPLWNFIYGALSGAACDVEAAVAALYGIPLDLVAWRMANRHRRDIVVDSRPDRFGRAQALRPLPWPERPLHIWNGNPYCLDGGDDSSEACGTFWLLPYWLGRYHGILADR